MEISTIMTTAPVIPVLVIDHLEQAEPSARPALGAGQHLPLHCGPFAGRELGDGTDVPQVQVVAGEVEDEVLHRLDAQAGQVGGATGAHALEELHGA